MAGGAPGGGATVKDVARAAGVAPTTVSNVFTGRRAVRDAVRRRVLVAAEQLGYRRNPLAIGLRTGRSPSVGLIFEDLSRPIAGTIQALQRAVERAGYLTFVLDTEEDPARETRFLELMAHYRPAGLVVQSAGADPRLYHRLADDGARLVLLERAILDLDADIVGWDHAAAAYDATDHLVRLGHRRIGLLVGNLTLAPRREAVGGWERALREHSLTPDPALIRSGPHRPEVGGWLIGELLSDLPDPPTAVVVTNRNHTMGAVATLNDRRVRMPDDLALVGMATDLIARLTTPSLTYVRIPDQDVAEHLARLLIERLADGAERPASRVILRAQLVVGGSCGAANHANREPSDRPA